MNNPKVSIASGEGYWVGRTAMATATKTADLSTALLAKASAASLSVPIFGMWGEKRRVGSYGLFALVWFNE